MPEYLKAAEVARRWRVSPRTLQRYIASGRLKADRLPGGQYRIRAEDAEAALATDTTTRCTDHRGW
ncbi:MAG: helix-turn-helix domain-containing protein [Mycobacterium sp.]